jgi:hypothetical protein
LIKPTVSLLKAEAGTGGNQRTTQHDCAQVPLPLGPVRGGYTGSIAQVPPGGGSVKVHLYIGVRRSYDVPPTAAAVWQFNPRNNQLTVFAKDLTDMMALTFGHDGTLVCARWRG